MAAHDKADKNIIYSSREARLLQDVPSHLQNVGNVRPSFDHVRDPLIKAQLNDLKKTEGKRREDSDGSKMVKLHKPFPELRPKHDLSKIRETFNKNWLSEDRRMQMKQFEAQERHLAAEKTQSHEADFHKHERGR